MKKTVLVFFILVVWAPFNLAGTYYLDAGNGQDSWPGTTTQPWKSLNKAKASLKPGDTVLIRPGSYGQLSLLSTNSGSEAGGRIIYKGDPATITPRASTWYTQPLARPTAATRPVLSGIEAPGGFHHGRLDPA